MLIQIKDDELKKAGIPFSRNTWYVWHCNGKYPELFVKIGSRLFISKEMWDKFEKKLIKKSEEKAARIQKILNSTKALEK